MINYNVKILVAFVEAFKGNKEIQQFLLKNYPELAAFIGAIKNDNKGYYWLRLHKFHHLAALHDAMDGEPEAFNWLKTNGYEVDAIMARAVLEDKDAIEWLDKNYKALKVVAELITKYIDYSAKQADGVSNVFNKIFNPIKN